MKKNIALVVSLIFFLSTAYHHGRYYHLQEKIDTQIPTTCEITGINVNPYIDCMLKDCIPIDSFTDDLMYASYIANCAVMTQTKRQGVCFTDFVDEEVKKEDTFCKLSGNCELTVFSENDKLSMPTTLPTTMCKNVCGTFTDVTTTLKVHGSNITLDAHKVCTMNRCNCLHGLYVGRTFQCWLNNQTVPLGKHGEVSWEAPMDNEYYRFMYIVSLCLTALNLSYFLFA